MAITLIKRPTDRCWSGNPIHYQLYSAAAEADSTIFFEIRIHFKRADASGYTVAATLPYNPVAGTAKIDIQDVLAGLMEFELPTLPATDEFNAPLFCRKMTGNFYITWREITTATPDPAWVTSESANARFVIKGGISFHKWRGDNYWLNYYDVVKPFLTWQINGRLASLTERMYLAWLNLDAISGDHIRFRRRLYFTDGTNDTVNYTCPALKNDVVFLPCGGEQLNLAAVDPAKKIYYWTIQVWNINTNLPLSEAFRFYLDNRTDNNSICLNYRNSIGGLDSTRIRGVIEYNLDRSFTNQEGIVLHNYFEGNYINPKIKAADSREKLIYKGDTGYVSKEEQDRLRDIHLQRECWWEQKKKWLPVELLTGSAKQKSSTDNLWSVPVEFAIANNGDSYYTPDNINLQDGNYPSVIACNAVISDPTFEQVDDTFVIDWDLVSGTPVKYLVSTPGVSGGVAAETTDTTYTFDWLPEGANVVTVQPVCLIGGEFVNGVPKTVTVSRCIPVTIDSIVGMPDAEAGAAYSYDVAVGGTTPHTLSAITKPAWLTLEVLPGIIRLTGIPSNADAATGVAISFTVNNCSGSSANVSDNIDVIENDTPPVAGFIVANNSADTVIEDVAPDFYDITAPGSFPINIGQFLEGSHIGHSGTITVRLTTTGGGLLKLYKNGVLIQSLTIFSSGNKNFLGVTFLSTDALMIRMDPA